MRPANRLSTLLAIWAVAVLASTAFAASSVAASSDAASSDVASAYAASAFTATPRCDGVRLRSGPAGWYPTKATIDQGASVTVAAEVPGARWSTLCGGTTYAGTTWAKVIAIDGTSTQAAYGVPALYAAFGLLRVTSPTPPPSASPPTASATPASTAAASAAAVPTPTATSTATAMPTPAATPASPGPPASSTPGAVPPGSSKPTASGATAVPAASLDPMSGLGSAAEFVILVLAITSVALAWVAYRDRRRREHQRAMTKVPASRLDDILE